MPDQFIELEGLTRAQTDDLQAASTSSILNCPASPADPAGRQNIRAAVTWGQQVQLPAGGFDRFRAVSSRRRPNIPASRRDSREKHCC